jgi:hypothetical protein
VLEVTGGLLVAAIPAGLVVVVRPVTVALELELFVLPTLPELAVLLCETFNALPGRARAPMPPAPIVEFNPEPGKGFLVVVGTNPAVLRAPGAPAALVDAARGFETTRLEGCIGDEGSLRLLAFKVVDRGIADAEDGFIEGEASLGSRETAGA